MTGRELGCVKEGDLGQPRIRRGPELLIRLAEQQAVPSLHSTSLGSQVSLVADRRTVCCGGAWEPQRLICHRQEKAAASSRKRAKSLSRERSIQIELTTAASQRTRPESSVCNRVTGSALAVGRTFNSGGGLLGWVKI